MDKKHLAVSPLLAALSRTGAPKLANDRPRGGDRADAARDRDRDGDRQADAHYWLGRTRRSWQDAGPDHEQRPTGFAADHVRRQGVVNNCREHHSRPPP